MAPLGVCGQVIPWNFPLLMLAWKVAPALAAGNTVVLKPAEYTPLTALLFAEISREAGLPKGVLNIVTGDGDTGAALVANPGRWQGGLHRIDLRRPEDPRGDGRAGQGADAGTGRQVALHRLRRRRSRQAVEGLVDAIWFNQGQVCCAGSAFWCRRAWPSAFHAKLKRRMDGLRLGDPLDKCIDVGAIVDPVQLETITGMVAGSEGEIYRAATPLPQGCFYPPTLITGLSASARLMQEEIFGPVLVSMTFRTPGEAVELANNTRYGLAARSGARMSTSPRHRAEAEGGRGLGQRHQHVRRRRRVSAACAKAASGARAAGRG
jgi:aldehyde dehydrogenase (NAD+)